MVYVNAYDCDEKCGNCGETWGAHIGLECPPSGAIFTSSINIGFRKFGASACNASGMKHYCSRECGHKGEHHFKGVYWVNEIDFDLQKELVKISTPGPRKPVPAVPVEVYHTKEFDVDEAWAAVVALSRGS
jgi:hypothetical protein